MGSQSKRRKGTKDNRSIVHDLKRETDQDANRTALLPDFEGLTLSPVGITQTDYIDVTDTIDPLQTNAPTAPAQVTGLNVITTGTNSLQVVWTSSPSSGVTSYKIYRGISTGTEIFIDSVPMPIVMSYADTNLLDNTTYYYKVSAVNAYGMEGTLSVEDSATTTAFISTSTASLYLALNNSLVDGSGNSNVVTYSPSGGNSAYGTPGQFGTHYGIVNYPSATNADAIKVTASTSTALDMTNGFSVSCWFYHPTAGSEYGTIASKWLDNSNTFQIILDRGFNNKIAVIVEKGDIFYKRESSNIITDNAWHHVVVTFNGKTNTVQVYVDKVAGIASTYPIFIPITVTQWHLGALAQPTLTTSTTFKGRIDEFMYFKGVVLTQAQVNNLYDYNTTILPIVPQLELHLDNNFLDTSPNSHVPNGSDGNGFISPGSFIDGWRCNYPVKSTPNPDIIWYDDHTALRLNTGVGFSISAWIYPVTFYTGGSTRKTFVTKIDDANNMYVLQVEPTTLLLQFHVKKGGTDYKRQSATGLNVLAWNHVVATFNGVTNTLEVYLNTATGAASTAATLWDSNVTPIMIISGQNSTYGSGSGRIEGYIDEVKYYQTVLTQQQVVNLMNNNIA